MYKDKIEISITRIPLEFAKHPKGSYLIEARWGANYDDFVTSKLISGDDYYDLDILQGAVSEVARFAIKDKRIQERPEYA